MNLIWLCKLLIAFFRCPFPLQSSSANKQLFHGNEYGIYDAYERVNAFERVINWHYPKKLSLQQNEIPQLNLQEKRRTFF